MPPQRQYTLVIFATRAVLRADDDATMGGVRAAMR